MSGDLERFDPAEQAGRISYEHLHRYALAREFVSGKRVLDLGCGTGYGTSILAAAAKKITGADLSSDAINIARKRYGDVENLNYVCANAYALPFSAEEFQVVVANEIIEHVEDHDAFVKEALRVLEPSGLFIVSTPNKPVYNRFKVPNSYHVSEMTIPEFQALLDRHFKHVRIVGTRMALISIGFDLENEGHRGNSASASVYRGAKSDQERPGIERGDLKLDEPEYLLAICSDRPIERQEMSASLFYKPDDDLWQEHEKVMAWASGLHTEDEALRVHLAQIQSDLEAAEATLRSKHAESDALQQHLGDLRLASTAALEALSREKQAVNAEAGIHLHASSRLIGKIIGAEVASDPMAVVEAIFDLNTKISAQEERLRKLDESEARAGELARTIKAQEERLAMLGPLETRAAELTAQLDAARVAAAESARRATKDEADVSSLMGELERARVDFAARDERYDRNLLALQQSQLAEAAASAETISGLRVMLATSDGNLSRMTIELSDAQNKSRENAERLIGEIETLQAAQSIQMEEAARAIEALHASRSLEAAEAADAIETLQASRSAEAEEAARAIETLRLSLEGEQAELARARDELLASRSEIERSHDRHAEKVRILEEARSLDAISAAEAASALEAALGGERAELARVVEELHTVQSTLAEISFVSAERIDALEKSRAAEARAADQAIRSLQQANEDDRAALARTIEQVRASDKAAPEISLDPKASRSAAKPEDPARAKFTSMHRRVRARLTDAPRKISGRFPPAPPPRKISWTDRLLGRTLPFKTEIFDPAWIARQRPDLDHPTLESFVRDPTFHDVDPHPLFSTKTYRAQNFDVMVSGMSPLQHYVLHGWREGRNPHLYFTNDWYLEQNPDVLAAGWLNPLDHYLRFGWREGRWPNPLFDPRAYLDRYIDVERCGMEPLTHYVAYGKAEGREPQFGTLDAHWQRFLPAAHRDKSLMNYLLLEAVAEDAEEPVSEAAYAVEKAQVTAPHEISTGIEPVWPPAPLNDYWPPQRLRNFIIQRHGDDPMDLYWYLLSVMETFYDRTEEFTESGACSEIVARIRSRSAARSAHAGGMPDVSIIIPVYNNILDTLLCIATVLENEAQHSFEIIVADDCSTDRTPEIVGGLGGVVHHLRQPRNLGFIGNCNAVAERASGRFIVLLNNDTLLMPGWLDELIAPFDALTKVGLSGSKLINWDGTLQEAGGIFWNDGSAWNFGRGREDPRAPEFSYLRDVDYCSGASIAIPTSLWRRLDGFDTIFEPAYCEDSDLAFRVRAEGYRTVLAAASEVIHHEGRSHGRDLNSGIKAYQITNQQRLLDRWRPVLESEHYPNAQNVLRARDRSRAKPHILIIDHYVPQWDRDAGSRTIFQFMEVLIDAGWIITFWPDNLYLDPHYTPALQLRGIEVIYGSAHVGGFAEFLRDRADLYDAVLLSRPHISEKYITDVRQLSSARIVYYGHDVHFQRMIAQRESGIGQLDDAAIEDQRRQEIWVCKHSDTIMYPSQEEAELMAGLVPGVRSLSVPAYSFRQLEIDDARAALDDLEKDRGGVSTLLFVGGFAHSPNVDGIRWFCEEVVPLLRVDQQPFRVKIVGSNPGMDIWSLESNEIKVLGFVSDQRLKALYREATAVIAPLRFGAGVKGKVVEAMANGRPIATTTVGAQGLDDARSFLFLGDTPEEFASAVRAAVNGRAGRIRAERALDYVQTRYSMGAVKDVLHAALELSI